MDYPFENNIQNTFGVIIMAGGLGKRMNSDLPKVLHKLNNLPLIIHILKTLIEIKPEKIFIIVGKYKEIIENKSEIAKQYKLKIIWLRSPFANGLFAIILYS